MKRKLNSLLGLVSCAVAATLVIIACGDGVPDLLEGELQISIDNSIGPLLDKDNGKIDSLMNDPNYIPPPSSAVLPVSSESQQTQSSSSEDTPLPISSSSGGLPPIPQSSSSAPVVQSSSSVPKSSSSAAPTPTGSCKESNPKAGFTCGWDGYSATTILTPGKILKPTGTPPAGCTVIWSYAPDTTGLILNNGCKQTDEAGFEALGSKNYVLFAKLTCDGVDHYNACEPKKGWSSKIAPSLTGTCKWDRNPPTTTTARGSTPSGVSVSDPDKVCSSPTVVYKYAEGTKDWDLKDGILDEWKNWDKKHKETYSDVTPTLNCPAYSKTITETPCAPLEVSAGADYIIDCTGKFDATSCKVNGVAGNAVTLKADECVEINVLGYTDQYNLPTVIMRCETQGTQQSASVTVSFDGKSTTTSGSWSVQPQVSLGKIKVGDNEFGTLCVTAISGATGLKCIGPSQ